MNTKGKTHAVLYTKLLIHVPTTMHTTTTNEKLSIAYSTITKQTQNIDKVECLFYKHYIYNSHIMHTQVSQSKSTVIVTIFYRIGTGSNIDMQEYVVAHKERKILQ